MPVPIESLSLEQARNAAEIRLTPAASFGQDVSWDWELYESGADHPLAATAFRAEIADDTSSLETAVALTLRKVGLTLAGPPIRVQEGGIGPSLHYRVVATA